MARPDRACGARGLRLRGAAARAEQAIEAVLERPRHARRDVDRLGQVGDLPDRRAARCPGATVVVSPLIALQREQVDDLRERAAGGAAQLNSHDPARPSARRAGRAGRGRARVRLPGPRAAGQPGRARRAGRRAAVAARGRRGALHLGVGPRLPARLPAPRRGGGGARAPDRAGPDRDRGAAGARRDRRAARRCATRRSSSAASTGPTSASRSSATTTRSASCAPCASTSAAAEPPGIVYVATRRAAEELAAELCGDGLRAASYHGGMRARERDDVAGALHGRRPRRHRRHDRVRHGRRQARTCAGSCTRRSPSRSTPTTRRSAARAATARPPGGALLPRRGPRPAALLRRRRPGRRRRDRRRPRGRARGRRGRSSPDGCRRRRSSARPSSPPRSRGSRRPGAVRGAARRRRGAAPTRRPRQAAIEAAAAAEEQPARRSTARAWT